MFFFVCFLNQSCRFFFFFFCLDLLYLLRSNWAVFIPRWKPLVHVSLLSLFGSISSAFIYCQGKHFFNVFSLESIVLRVPIWEQHINRASEATHWLIPSSFSTVDSIILFCDSRKFSILWVRSIQALKPRWISARQGFHLNQYFPNMINWVEVEMAALGFFFFSLLAKLLCLATLRPADYSIMAVGVSSRADTQTLRHTHKHVGSRWTAEWNMDGGRAMIGSRRR